MPRKKGSMDRKQYQHEYYLKRRAEKEKLEKMKPVFGVSEGTTQIGGFFSLAGTPSVNGVNEKTIINQFKSWVYTCSTINGSAVASANLRLYAVSKNGDNKNFLHETVQKDREFLNYVQTQSSVKSLAKVKSAQDVVEIVDHPLLTLLQKFNGYNNNFESFELTSIYLDLVGNGYWYVVKNNLGVPEDIWILQSQYVTIVPAKNTFIKGYIYGQEKPGVDLVKFKPDEIIHFKTPNPSSIYYGLGCAQAVIGAVNRFNMMDQSEGARLRNMGRPDFAVKYKNGKIDSSEINKVEKMWNKAFGGPNRDGKIKVMDEDWDLVELGFSPREMEYLSGRVWSLKEVAAAFGIPYSILDTSDVKKATSELSEYWYAKNSILPRITRIEEKLNEKLVPMFDDSGRMFLLYDNPVPRDQAQLTEENAIYIESGVKTINEVRLSLQLPKYPDPLYDEPFAKGKTFTDDMSGFGVETGSPQKEKENPKPGRPKRPKKVEEEEE